MTNISRLWRHFVASAAFLTLNLADAPVQAHNNAELTFLNPENAKTITLNQTVKKAKKYNSFTRAQWKKDHQGQSLEEQQDDLYKRIVDVKSRKSYKKRAKRFEVIADRLNLFKDDHSQTIATLKDNRQTDDLNALYQAIDIAETANIRNYLAGKTNTETPQSKLLAFDTSVRQGKKAKLKAKSERFISDSTIYAQTLELVAPPEFVKDKIGYVEALKGIANTESTYNPAPTTNPTHKGYYQFDAAAQKRYEPVVGVPFPKTSKALSTWEGKITQHKYARAYYIDQYDYIVKKDAERISKGKKSVTDRRYMVSVKNPENNKKKDIIVPLTAENLAFSLWAGNKYYKQLEQMIDSKANRHRKILKLPRHKGQDFAQYAAFAKQDVAHREHNEKLERELISAGYKVSPAEYREEQQVITAPVIERPVLAETQIDTLKTRFIQSASALVLFDKPRIIAVSGSAVPQTALTN